MPKRLVTSFFLPLLFTLQAPAKENISGFIQNFLTQVAEQSSAYKVTELENQSSLVNSGIELNDFDLSGYLTAEFTDSDDVQFSPFSSDSTKSYDYTAGVSKKWLQGFETSLDYTLTDSLTTFVGRDNSDFISPSVSLSLKTNLLQDLISGKNRKLNLKIDKQEQSISLKTKIEKKKILIAALLVLSETLEIKNELVLQKTLCQQIKQQSQKLKQKRKRRSVTERDYLLSLKDLNTCTASVKRLEKSIIEKKEDLFIKYNMKDSFYSNLSIQYFFDEVSQIYSRDEFLPEKVKIENRGELVSLKRDFEVSKLEGEELSAEKRANINLELKAGLKGLQNDFSSSHEDITKANFPYIIGSVSIDFPFANRTAKTNYRVNELKTEVLRQQLNQTKKENKSRFRVLTEGLKKDFLIYKDYQANVKLSQRILTEAERDFSNGRIDFFNLSEFQKGLIQSRQQLASLRTQIIIQTVEYVDYFQFFERYF